MVTVMATTLNMSDISDFYNNQSVLITGATGFIGKVLLEKLLYSCSGINYVYVLIREKKNKLNTKSDDRFEELLKSKIFDRIRKDCPSAMRKIVPVWGDLTKPGLGISKQAESDLLDNVSIVQHCAATVKFNEPLKVAVEINLVGTKNVMKLFKRLKSQLAFIHLSTAYANCHRDQIDEVIYPSPVSPTFLLQAYESLKVKEMDWLTDVISEGRPNTYTLTKAITEAYLEENSSGLPVAIVRPSIVGNSMNEPSRGWGDSFAILSGITYAVGLGLIRNLPVNGQARLDVIPADMVCNLMIAVAWHTSKTCPKNKSFPVYNFVSGSKNPITFQEYMDMGLRYVRDKPALSTVNYPRLSFTRNTILLFFGIFFNHYLPAVIMDFIRILKGKNSKYFKIYRRFFSTLPLKTFFMQREFNFQYENCTTLYQSLSPSDQETFNFDIVAMDWSVYLSNMFEGIRDFFLPNEERDIVSARRKLHKLYIRSVVLDVLFGLAVPLLLYFTVLCPLYNNFSIQL